MSKFLIVIFGATGDLTKRKLIPALYNLTKNKNFKNDFKVIGVGRKHHNSETFTKKMMEFNKSLYKERKSWEQFCSRVEYFKADFKNKSGMLRLANYIKSKKVNNVIYYLATMPENYLDIIRVLRKYKLNEEKNGWKKIMFEKPFGFNLKSAKKINKTIKKAFKENQVYRVDHYIGKESVENILTLRFNNIIFEPVWNRDYIEYVQIIANENLGVEGRMDYYDKHGVLNDMIENHFMHLLSFITMDKPKNLESQNIREEKIKVINSIRWTRDLVLGQYEGYKKELKKQSNTPTFTALKLKINNKRWRGVPFYLKTGKRLNKKEALIYIKFKDLDCKECISNELIIYLQPEQDIDIGFNVREYQLQIPTKSNIKKAELKFCHNCSFSPNTPLAYENLLVEAVKGNYSLFISWGEIKSSWEYVDNLKKLKSKLYIYKKGTKGPKQAYDLTNWKI